MFKKKLLCLAGIKHKIEIKSNESLVSNVEGAFIDCMNMFGDLIRKIRFRISIINSK